jgi:diguanylate cyclase (GGDEF)-like protein
MTSPSQGTATPANTDEADRDGDLDGSGAVVAIDALRGQPRLLGTVRADGEVEETLLQSSHRPIVRLLIIEDDEEDFDLVEALLSRAPETRFEVVWATSVEAGLRRLASESFDACLVDDDLPGRSGLDFVEVAMRRGFERPIILLSENADEAFEYRAIEAGAADFLDKEECDTGRLDRAIRFAIGRARNSRRLDPPPARDSLTGLANRTLFLGRLASALGNARRNRLGAAVLAIDLDGFRPINDRLGHDAGDRLLTIIAERLGHRLRESDTIARLDGDGFCVLLENLQRPEDAAVVVQKLMQVIEAPMALAGEVLRLTASFGVTLYPIDASEPEEILRLADSAMHRAKAAGGRACRFHDPNVSAATCRIVPMLAERMIEPAPKGGLDQALQEGRFELFFQPQATLRSPLVALTARPRLRDPERGVLGPDRFLGMVEEPGFLDRLMLWMVEAGAIQMAIWRKAGCRVDHLAVPLLTAGPLGWLELADRAIAIFQRHGLEAKSLELELAEAPLYQDLRTDAGHIAKLRAKGLRLAVHGYGEAMVSLTLLRDCPIDTLKLAQALLEGVPGDRHRTLFADAVIQLGRHLGVRLVAEGVPGNGQLQLLKRAGCDAAECTMSDPAMTAEEAQSWLARNQRRRETLG